MEYGVFGGRSNTNSLFTAMRLEMNLKHFLFSLVSSVFLGQMVSGQQVTEPGRPPAAESQQESDADVLKEQIIYVPYEKLHSAGF